MVQEPLKSEASADKRLAAEIVENFEWGERTRLDSLAQDIEVIEDSIWAGDFLEAIDRIAAVQTALETLTAACVAGARHAGVTWAEVGDALGVRLQTAWERYRHLTDVDPEAALVAVREVEERATSQRAFLEQILAGNPSLTAEQQAAVRRLLGSDARAARSMRATLRREGLVSAAAPSEEKGPPKKSATPKAARRAKGSPKQ